MTRLLAFACALCVALPLSGCVAYPYSYTAAPPKFDQAWNAALGAAADAGLQVTSADRTTGVITDNTAGTAVTIKLQPQPDGGVRVVFNAPNAKESNPTLNDRWLAAYQRRMGR